MIINPKILQNSPVVNFKGNTNGDQRPKGCKNKYPFCVNETYFFRNLETLEFVTDYITKNFKNGTHIADFGCSSGEETYSLAMMLNEHNKDKKYKITGYDLSKREIENAKQGMLFLKEKPYEGFLIFDNLLNAGNRKYRELFYQCFENLDDKLQDKAKFKKQVSPEKFNILQRINPSIRDKMYMPKNKIFDQVVDFEQGDICELGKSHSVPENTGVIFFKNALYHLSDAQYKRKLEGTDLSLIGDVVKEVAGALPSKGIFIVGQLYLDHCYEKGKSRTREIYQNGEKITVCDSTPFHDLMRKNGFTPVFYEQDKDENGWSTTADVYLPSVWEKK